jgi:beta-glucosidase
MLFSLLSAVVAASVWAAPAKKAVETPNQSKTRRDKFISQLMAKMTIEEKAGQMNQYSADMAVTGAALNPHYKEDLAKGRVGSVLNATTPKATRDLQKIAVEQTRLHIPLLFGFDVIHGHRTIFPIPLGEAASWNLPLIEKSARIAGKEAAADGLHWTFAPMVDIARDPRWGRISEGAGEDTWLGSKIAAARVKGFQGERIGATDSVLACVKHFAAYGAPIAGRDYNTVDMSERELMETYLPPYEAAFKAGARTGMTSFNEINGVPSTGNDWLLTKLLRGQWGFKGFIVTDYGAVDELVPHGFAEDEKDAARLGVNAGADMDMQSEAYVKHLPALVREGKVKVATVNTSVRRILEAKWDLGLFDDPYRYSNEERAKSVIMAPEHLAHARDIARRSIVLLKNDNKVLPLKRAGTIALIGPHADNKHDQNGNWSSMGDEKDAVSLIAGMTSGAQGKVKILHARGANLLPPGPMRDFLNKHGAGEPQPDGRSDEEMMKEAVKVANKADVVVLALGETQGMTGEAASRAEIRIPPNQVALLKRIKAETKKPVVLVLYNGRPLALENEIGMVDAAVEAWFLGTQAGNAIADVLYGDYNPSGKLPVTFPRTEGQIPIYYSAKNTGRPDDPKEKYRSKYVDMPNTPLFAFGHGLSYTQFEISEPRLSATKINPSQKLRVDVTVKNVGDYDGEETVQLYVRDMVGSVTRPVKQLRGFEKVFLKKGESRDIAMNLTIDDLKFYDRQMKWTYEPGAFKVMVGPDSVNVKSADFTLINGKGAKPAGELAKAN